MMLRRVSLCFFFAARVPAPTPPTPPPPAPLPAGFWVRHGADARASAPPPPPHVFISGNVQTLHVAKIKHFWCGQKTRKFFSFHFSKAFFFVGKTY
jgi:hypothetical protein